MIIAIVCPHVTDEQAQHQFGEPGVHIHVARHEQALGGPLVFRDRTTPVTQEAEMLLGSLLGLPKGTQTSIKEIAPTDCVCDSVGQERESVLYSQGEVGKKAALRNMLLETRLFLLGYFDPSTTTFERWMFDPEKEIRTSLDHNKTATERA